MVCRFRCPTGFKGTPRVYVHSKHGGYASKAPNPSAASDYTGKFHAKHLKPQTKYSYYVKCGHALSAKAHFKTPPKPHQKAAAKFAWVADVAGQGYGRNADLAVGDIKGGFLFAEAVRREGADFVLFQGVLHLTNNAVTLLARCSSRADAVLLSRCGCTAKPAAHSRASSGTLSVSQLLVQLS